MIEYNPQKTLCSCARLTCGDLADTVRAGATTLEEVRARTRATAFCGSCSEKVDAFLQLLLKGEVVPAATASLPVSAELPAAIYRRICENIYQVGGGRMNSYLLLDQQNVLIDLPEGGQSRLLLRNLDFLLQQNRLDFVLLNRVTPDRLEALSLLLARWPKVHFAASPAGKALLARYCGADFAKKVQEIRDGISILMGKHILSFRLTPGLPGAETMAVYERTSETLFCGAVFASAADAGAIFADQAEAPLARMRTSFARTLAGRRAEIERFLSVLQAQPVCRFAPEEGLIWRRDTEAAADALRKWCENTPEERGAVIACASAAGDPAPVCRALADLLGERGLPVRVFDVQRADPAEIFARALRYDRLILASCTEEGTLPAAMEGLLAGLRRMKLPQRRFFLLENDACAPDAAAQMAARLELSPLPRTFTFSGALSQMQWEALCRFADDIAAH